VISRRVFVRNVGLIALAGCTHVGFEPRQRRFARVRVSRDRVIRTVQGTRPFRPAGFVVRAEALLRDLREGGARVVVRDLYGRDDVLALPEPLVANCTGLGARELFGDTGFVPARGQLVSLLPQPEIDYLTLGDNLTYMFPRRDGILLGGTFERGMEVGKFRSFRHTPWRCGRSPSSPPCRFSPVRRRSRPNC